ncbi:peptide chain release factor H [Desulfoluna butyratoxydans]|uniref:Peptide chain release factor class i/class ii n=1 Tax=Desulfoluna butyratoxydans TaxID=231438 RepID=A0A4U8YTB1_9BACT|nr:peptide chain release factor H [Desulfoluna butyratoxydans]VFQ47220.1 peptide chain release factor class i/class ii [Desulfoluna butyratoxydans]
MSTWIQITAGKGPAECCYAAHHVMKRFSGDARARQIKVVTLETIAGPRPGTLKSALLSLNGPDIEGFVASWAGTIQWIGQSPFRPGHKRKNWFVGIYAVTPPEETDFRDKDLRIDTMRASGPGGQHVNTSNTAIRITHLPSRLVAVAQEERSQHLNKRLAMARLKALLQARNDQASMAAQHAQWESHTTLERGNPVRVFHGPGFKEKR